MPLSPEEDAAEERRGDEKTEEGPAREDDAGDKGVHCGVKRTRGQAAQDVQGAGPPT